MPVTCHRKVHSMKLLDKFLRDQSGTTQIEYAVIGALITVAIISGVGAVGNAVGKVFNYAATKGVPPLQ